MNKKYKVLNRKGIIEMQKQGGWYCEKAKKKLKSQVFQHLNLLLGLLTAIKQKGKMVHPNLSFNHSINSKL